MIFLNSNLEAEPDIIDGSGPWLYAATGTKLFDCWLGSGTLIFGHDRTNSLPIGAKLLPNGVMFDDQTLDDLSALVNFTVSGIGFQTGGSGAITRACRLARAATGRLSIAVVRSFWHGSDDCFLFRDDHMPISTGVPIDKNHSIQYFPSTEHFLREAVLTNFAALVVEPYQGANPSLSMLQSIGVQEREALREAGTLLICDEVITGFRECYGSCLESRRSDPDIVVFGKAIADGFPAGVVLVSDAVSLPPDRQPFWGGTFAASPWQIGIIASHLRKLRALNYELILTNHNDLKSFLRSNILFEEFGYELVTGHSFSRISIPTQKKDARGFLGHNVERKIRMHQALSENGLFIGNNGLIFPSVFNINISRRQ